MRWLFVTAVALSAAGCRPSLRNSGRADAPEPTPPTFLTDIKSWVVKSTASGRSYQISAALPDRYSEQHAAYPVLYAADANTEFGIVVETARLLSFAKEIPDLVIVGIGYPNAGQGFQASWAPRTLDLTPTADPGWVKDDEKDSRALGVPPAEASGGAAQFLSFIRGELAPAIERTYNVSHEDRAWFGHSFGGLFGTYALFNNEGLFKRFIIGSPSLWWGRRALFSVEELYAASGKPLPARVFFSVGQLEDRMDPRYPMVADLREFTERLTRRKYKGLELEAHFFDDETHGSVIPATVSKGLRFVYSSAASANVKPPERAENNR